MINMKTLKYILKVTITMTVVSLTATSCMKDFLDIKREKTQVIPRTLEDYRSLFENDLLNYYSSHLLGEIGSDDYYVQNDQWNTLANPIQKNAYVWADEIYQGEPGEDWNRGYEKILFANFVLEGLNDISETDDNKELRDELAGAAYFFRGANFFLLAQLFCKQYVPHTAKEDLGLPLRTVSNINATFPRSNLQRTYDQIISDLNAATELLPDRTLYSTRPNKAAAFAMLANVYLQIENYQAALRYSDQAIASAPQLLDYNSLDMDLSVPFPLYGQGNDEIIFYSSMNYVEILTDTKLTIDSVLYESYHEHDLRRQAFFFDVDGRITFKGHYSGSSVFLFSGLTTAELYLVRAECNARIGNIHSAVEDINTLLSKRFPSEKFEPVRFDTPQRELLLLILSERRKELVLRGRRWSDLKRFESDPRLAKTLKRKVGDSEYILPVGSTKWVWPIPPDVISLSNIRQNER